MRVYRTALVILLYYPRPPIPIEFARQRKINVSSYGGKFNELDDTYNIIYSARVVNGVVLLQVDPCGKFSQVQHTDDALRGET